jgi:RimJ/RimL family protein N-acetyltransferase
MHILDTQRLVLRPLAIDDLADLHREIYSDNAVVRYYSGKGVRTLEQTRQYLADHLVVWQDDELGRLAVVRKEDGQFLGQVHLDCYINSFNRWQAEPDPPYNSLEVELAFAFGQRFWGKSYAFEACQAMIDYAFGTLKLRRLVGGAMRENVRSIALQRRLGYRIELSLDGAGYVTILDNHRLCSTGASQATAHWG